MTLPSTGTLVALPGAVAVHRRPRAPPGAPRRGDMRRRRDRFTFDHHVPALVGFLREVIDQHRARGSHDRWQPTVV